MREDVLLDLELDQLPPMPPPALGTLAEEFAPGQRMARWLKDLASPPDEGSGEFADKPERGPAETETDGDYRRETTSVNQSVRDGDGRCVELAQLMSDQGCHRLERRDEAAQRDLASDVRACIVQLSPEDRDLCRLLQNRSPTETAHRLGISRGTLYDRMGRLRPLFEDAGLKEYL